MASHLDIKWAILHHFNRAYNSLNAVLQIGRRREGHFPDKFLRQNLANDVNRLSFCRISKGPRSTFLRMPCSFLYLVQLQVFCNQSGVLVAWVFVPQLLGIFSLVLFRILYIAPVNCVPFIY